MWLTIYIIFFGGMSTQVHCPFSNWVVFLLLSYTDSLYIMDMRPLSDEFSSIFSHSVGFSLNFGEFQFIYFFFCCLLVLLVSYSRIHCQIKDHEGVSVFF